MTKNNKGIIVGCEFANVTDLPEDSSPIACQVSAGTRVIIISRSNRRYFEVKVSNAISGFVPREFVKTE